MIEEPVDPRFEGSNLIIETGGETEVYDSKFLAAALLVFVAKGDGTISDLETEEMLAAIGEHYNLQSAESLELLTRAMASLSENPDLNSLLRELGTKLDDAEKEEIAIMLLKVIAADGRKDVEEMEKMDIAAEIIDISPEIMHRAHARYFDEQEG